MFEFFASEKAAEQFDYLLSSLPLAIWETLYSTVLATVLAYVIGLPLGVLLVVGEPGGIRPLPRPAPASRLSRPPARRRPAGGKVGRFAGRGHNILCFLSEEATNSCTNHQQNMKIL